MIKFFLLLSISLTASLSFADNTDTEKDFAAIRARLGITDVEVSTDQYKAFSFRAEGFFVISNTTFKNSREAQNFCSTLSEIGSEDNGSFSLVSVDAAFGFTLSGLPFLNLHKSSVIDKPVILFEGQRTGVAFWSKQYNESIDADTVLTFTDGNGAGASDFQNLDKLNKRLVKAGKSPLALEAVCLDEKLSGYFD